jgi:hypothetical protein
MHGPKHPILYIGEKKIFLQDMQTVGSNKIWGEIQKRAIKQYRRV